MLIHPIPLALTAAILALLLRSDAAAADSPGDEPAAATPPLISSDPASQFFERSDKDGDGYIARDEVAGNSRLHEEWQRFELTGDDRIGRAEFSAFENGTGAINPDAYHGPLGGNPAVPEAGAPPAP